MSSRNTTHMHHFSQLNSVIPSFCAILGRMTLPIMRQNLVCIGTNLILRWRSIKISIKNIIAPQVKIIYFSNFSYVVITTGNFFKTAYTNKLLRLNINIIFIFNNCCDVACVGISIVIAGLYLDKCILQLIKRKT